MSKHQLSHWKILVLVAVVCVTFILVVNADVPKGWILSGSKPADYETGVDAGQTYLGHASAFLKSKQIGSVDGFGTLMQMISAEQYLGKRIRLSGLAKSDEVTSWAGLWMRVDKGKEVVAFDNMQDRSIKSTTGWQRYEVVLDVPPDATGIAFGVLLNGPGQVWLNGTKFEIVGLDVPTTSPSDRKPDRPVNLEFSE